ncbi:MAG: hypothetical protein JWM19_2392 [Actinomycetia bacterium]|nr:hypothetical protein [Actinomycetes bacterium]
MPVPGDIVIAARRKRTIFWGVCAFFLALGLVAAWSAQPTTGGKVTGAVFFAVLIALCAFLWWYQNRRRSRIQVTSDEIRYWYQGRHLEFTLSREPAAAAELAVIEGRYLALRGSGDRMDIRYFSRPAVRRACESRGWSVT